MGAKNGLAGECQPDRSQPPDLGRNRKGAATSLWEIASYSSAFQIVKRADYRKVRIAPASSVN